MVTPPNNTERWSNIRPKKNIVCFRFVTDPIKKCATQIYFMDFQKKKKIKTHKLRDELLAAVTLTKKTLRQRRGGVKKRPKNKKSLHNVQITLL